MKKPIPSEKENCITASKRYREYITAFSWNLLLAVFTFGFFMLREGGLFTLSYDFNSQIVPFTKLSLDTLHDGSGFWNWNLDLGADIVNTMGYYSLGSPFFWFFSWALGENVLYILGWEYILKYAVAGLSAYAYLRRYAKKETALTGSVLYAFSGFQTVNLMFSIFHDAVALFPFMLLAFEELMENDRKRWFAFAVCFNAAVNYYCFIGEVIFLVIYYVLRYCMEDWRKYAAKSGRCLIEGCLGAGMAAVIFLPSVLNVLQNSRVTQDIAWNSFFSVSRRDLLQYIWSFIAPAERCMDRSVISVEDFTSRSAYLPMIGVTLEAAYFLCHRKKDWLKRLLLFMTILMILPVGNGIFALFTTNYCRWFYMPLLFMILASVRVMDDWGSYHVSIAAILMLAVEIALYFIFQWWDKNKFQLIFHEQSYLVLYATMLLGILVVNVCCVLRFKDKIRNTVLLYGISVLAVFTTGYTCNLYQNFGDGNSFSYQDKIEILEEAQTQTVGNYRILTDEDNISMLGKFKGINSFISTISGSIPEFWDSLGLSKVIFSPEGPAGTNELLSVKYYITKSKEAKGTPVKEYRMENEQYYLYEQENSLNIGFTYDTYLTKSEFKQINPEKRALVMLQTLIVADEEEKKVVKYLKKEEYTNCEALSEEKLPLLVQEHQTENARDFYITSDEFGCNISVDKAKYAFFSVPYSHGWKATVNGSEAEILDINGLMAVPIEAGENSITFCYANDIFIFSIVISVIFWIIWIIAYNGHRVRVRK